MKTPVGKTSFSKSRVVYRRLFRGWTTTLLWGCSLWGASVAAQSEGEVVDRAVAVIDGRLLTQSELEFEARVTLLKAGASLTEKTPLDSATLREALEYAIAVRLQNDEAEKLQAYPVEEREVRVAIEQLRSRFSDGEAFSRFLQAFDIDQAQLVVTVARQIRAAHVLDARIRLRAQVSEKELRAYFDSHVSEFTRVSFESVREALRERLLNEKRKSLALAELKRVRKGADVRILAPWAQPTVRGARP